MLLRLLSKKFEKNQIRSYLPIPSLPVYHKRVDPLTGSQVITLWAKESLEHSLKLYTGRGTRSRETICHW